MATYSSIAPSCSGIGATEETRMHEDVFERHGFNKRPDHVASCIVKTLSTRVATCGGMGRSNDWRVPGIKRRLTRPVYED